MNYLSQHKPTDVGPGNVIGVIQSVEDNPMDALKTILCQVNKLGEWNASAVSEALSKAEENMQGISYTLECFEMQLEKIVSNPLFVHASQMLKVIRQYVDERERGREWVSDDTYDMAVNVLQSIEKETQS